MSGTLKMLAINGVMNIAEEGLYNRSDSPSHYDADCHVDQVTFKSKVLEIFEEVHGLTLENRIELIGRFRGRLR